MDTATKKMLKAKAHHLKPVVLVGSNGVTGSVIAETDAALKAHELIKVKIYGAEKEDRMLMSEELTNKVQAELVQMIGNISVLFRKREE